MYVCMYVCIYIYIISVRLSHEQIATASCFTFWSSQLALSPNSLYLHAYLEIQRRHMKCGSTQELPSDGDYQM